MRGIVDAKKIILSNLFVLVVFFGAPVFAQADSTDEMRFQRYQLKNVNLLCACKGGEERERLKVLTGNIWHLLSENANISYSLDNNEIVVTDIQKNLREVDKLVKILDDSAVLTGKLGEKQSYPRINFLYCLKHLPSSMVGHWDFDDETERWHGLLTDKKSSTGKITYYPFNKYISLEDTPQEVEKLEYFLESIDKPTEADLRAGETKTKMFVLKNVRLGYCKADGIALSPNKPTDFLLRILESLLSSRGKVEIDVETNTLIVTDLSSKLEVIGKYLESADRSDSYVNKDKGCLVGNQTDQKLNCN